MRPLTRFLIVFFFVLFLTFSQVYAGSVDIPNTFTAGTPAIAREVNDNFASVEVAIDDNDSRIAALESAVTSLQAAISTQADTIANLESTITAQEAVIASLQGTVSTITSDLTDTTNRVSSNETSIGTLENNNVQALDPYLTVDEINDIRGPLVRLTGVNLQIVNGDDNTQTINGLGNLIVGYDEGTSGPETIEYCLAGTYTDQTECEDAGYPWFVFNSSKLGSHNLVVGTQNHYSSYGAIVAGFGNLSAGAYASAIGGSYNYAANNYSLVAGGSFNRAYDASSSVHGGYRNIAYGPYSGIFGGSLGEAAGGYSSVLGGLRNRAIGQYGSVLGGNSNDAFGYLSAVAGGTANRSNGRYSIVTGGRYNTADGEHSSITGGNSLVAPNTYDVVNPFHP